MRSTWQRGESFTTYQEAGRLELAEAAGLKDMGRTMGALKERYAGVMDFKKASAVVKELLG